MFTLLASGLFSVACSIPSGEGLIPDITADELRDHVYYLASDRLQGRKPGTEGYNTAASYAALHFLQADLESFKNGLTGSRRYYQHVPINHYEQDKTNTGLTLSINGTTYSYSASDRFAVTFEGPFEQNVFTGQAVFVGYGIHKPEFGWDDYQNIDLNRKWAVMLHDVPDSLKNDELEGIPEDHLSHTSRISEAQQAGAIGVISLYSKEYFNMQWRNVLRSSHTFYGLPQTGAPGMIYGCPRIAIDSSAIRLLFMDQPFDPLNHEGEYGSFDLKGVEISLNPVYEVHSFSSVNIVAVVHGEDPQLKNEFISVGAHLDHIGAVNNFVINGADDNASGSAAVLEVAEKVARSRPKRSVLFLLYTAEEIGLLGSFYFVSNAPVPAEKIIANINLDMVGRPDGDADDLAVIGADRINPHLKDLIVEVNGRTVNILLDQVDSNSLFERSDQYSFYLRGIPSVLFITGLHNDYHTSRDDADKIDYDFLQQVSELTYEVIMELAGGEVFP